MANPLKISVIVPVFNCEKFVAAAIESITQQNHFPIEIIAVDDGSKDDSAQIIQTFSRIVKYVHQKNKGPAAARNTGISIAAGDIIGFLDADDLWPPNRLEMMLPEFEKDQEREVVLGLTRHLTEEENIKKNVDDSGQVLPLLGSALFRRHIFEKIGKFDETLTYSEDQDWFLRAKEENVSMIVLKAVTLIKRRHPDNMTAKTSWKDVDIIKVLKRSLDRRRRKNKQDIVDLKKLSDFFE